jgi:hypothetical protein
MHAITSNSAQHVTATDRNNAHGISNNLVAPTLMQCGRPIFFRSIALIGVLLAFGMGGVAQAQQPSAANFTAENTGGAARNVAVGEEQPATPASTAVPNEPQSAAGLSKEIANPLSNLWLLQIQQNNTLMGKATYVQSNLQFQPLIPIPVSAHWSLISRPVIQVFSSQPYPVVTSVDHATHTATANIDRTTSLGDTVFATALSPDSSLVGKWLVAAGATFVFPTATHHALGQDTWQAGPTVALGYKGDKWLAFVFPQHWWKVGGSGRKTNQTLVQYNFSWNFDNGWSLGTSPNLTVNW